MLAIFLVLVYLVNATLSTQKTKFNELGPLQTKWLAKKPDMNWHTLQKTRAIAAFFLAAFLENAAIAIPKTQLKIRYSRVS